MDVHESTVPIGDEPRDKKMYLMPTCPDCGGRGGEYDSEGNWYKCHKCNGTGQVD
jgi:DnaJ-class molecular chaperone